MLIFRRMPIEAESPEEIGYDTIEYNLAESSVTDLYINDICSSIDLGSILLQYGEHRGNLSLRKKVIEGQSEFIPNDVLITSSAATALFIIHISKLSQNNHLIVLRPNYATNLATPETIGCEISYVDLFIQDNFQFKTEQIIEKIKPNTSLISITHPHNPTGVKFDNIEIKKLIQVCEEKNILLLVDETYRYLEFKGEIKPYWASRSKNVISVCSLSKAFGAPGVRIGWIINKNAELMQEFLAVKEQIVITNSVVDEYIAEKILDQTDKIVPKFMEQARVNYSILCAWLEENRNYIDCVLPDAGVVCFPKFKQNIDFYSFYQKLHRDYKTMVGPGHWFERGDEYFRLGFGWIESKKFEIGLENIIECYKSFI